ncbi:MAG: fructose-6-phosphate aldolase [Flammeovirgaceae bacterium TMED32]|nr:MAG: fructose-6-phosphate aldolase [Flammeovirgaceae bacterium TMED32]|tara:strand:+ start:2079 stop:2282 length:204 start_codon:yes stop_codon:yes gene_type:complete
MYIIKIRGKAKIPDYIQLRNDKFVLIGYFRADKLLTKLERLGLGGKEEKLKLMVEKMPFGKLKPLEL